MTLVVYLLCSATYLPNIYRYWIPRKWRAVFPFLFLASHDPVTSHRLWKERKSLLIVNIFLYIQEMSALVLMSALTIMAALALMKYGWLRVLKNTWPGHLCFIYLAGESLENMLLYSWANRYVQPCLYIHQGRTLSFCWYFLLLLGRREHILSFNSEVGNRKWI